MVTRSLEFSAICNWFLGRAPGTLTICPVRGRGVGSEWLAGCNSLGDAIILFPMCGFPPGSSSLCGNPAAVQGMTGRTHADGPVGRDLPGQDTPPPARPTKPDLPVLRLSAPGAYPLAPVLRCCHDATTRLTTKAASARRVRTPLPFRPASHAARLAPARSATDACRRTRGA